MSDGWLSQHLHTCTPEAPVSTAHFGAGRFNRHLGLKPQAQSFSPFGTEAKPTKMRPALLTVVQPKHADLLAFAFELKDAKVVELPTRRQHGYEVF